MSPGISLSGLASAVANEGRVGVIGAVGIGMFELNFIPITQNINVVYIMENYSLPKGKGQKSEELIV